MQEAVLLGKPDGMGHLEIEMPDVTNVNSAPIVVIALWSAKDLRTRSSKSGTGTDFAPSLEMPQILKPLIANSEKAEARMVSHRQARGVGDFLDEVPDKLRVALATSLSRASSSWFARFRRFQADNATGVGNCSGSNPK